GADGNFYGSSPPFFDRFVGFFQGGSPLQVTPSGAVTILPGVFNASASFRLQGGDGGLYVNGFTPVCGAVCLNVAETLFRVTPSGIITSILFHFGSPGLNPSIDAQSGDGNSLGSQHLAGSSSPLNIIFRITPSGTMTTLYTFTGAGNVDGEWGSVAFEAPDGNMYGTAFNVGVRRVAAIFRLTPGGAYTILHSFTGGAADGASPAALILGSDGNFYGTTTQGGSANLGTVF